MAQLVNAIHGDGDEFDTAGDIARRQSGPDDRRSDANPKSCTLPVQYF